MTEEELKSIEADLADRGYRKMTTCLSSHESWGWFKAWKDHNGEILYQIEWRVWDYRNFSNAPEPYGVDMLILDGGANHRIDLEITSPKFDIPTVEDIAFSLHNMLSPYIELYSKIIDNESVLIEIADKNE